MAASKGRSFVVQFGDGATAESFTTIAGLRSNTITMNGETVEVSDKSSRWRALLADAGILSFTMTGSGVFKDDASEETLRSQAHDQTLNNYRMIDEDTGDYWEGAFQVSTYERTGEHNGAVEFSATFESSGEITFTEA